MDLFPMISDQNFSYVWASFFALFWPYFLSIFSIENLIDNLIQKPDKNFDWTPLTPQAGKISIYYQKNDKNTNFPHYFK